MPASTPPPLQPAAPELPPRPTATTRGVPARRHQGAAVLLLAAAAAAWPVPASWAATPVVEPASAASSGASGASGAARPAKAAQATPAARLVDINTASRAALMKLPGIGPAEADAVIAGRPYRTKADLATHKVLPTGVYLSLRRSIVALPVAKSGAGKSGHGRPADAAPGAGSKS
jgi:competence protein ComEA